MTTTVRELEVLGLAKSSLTPTIEKEEEYSIPLCIDDIISICKEYSKLGWQIQTQMESILECGVEEAIRNNSVQRASLPHIKAFLLKICDNPYFGDAVSLAHDCIALIQKYEDDNKVVSSSIMFN